MMLRARSFMCRFLGHRWQKRYWHDTRYVLWVECKWCLKTPYDVLGELEVRR